MFIMLVLNYSKLIHDWNDEDSMVFGYFFLLNCVILLYFFY